MPEFSKDQKVNTTTAGRYVATKLWNQEDKNPIDKEKTHTNIISIVKLI